MTFPEFFGNEATAGTLLEMISAGRIPQTILLSGPEGIGKATLARRFAAALLGAGWKVERDDLSLPHNLETIADREKWTAERRAEDPFLFGSHPDFLTFPPDGPLRQLSIQQMRMLRERAPFKPLQGSRRVFLIDHLDRANEQAANSLLKVLEEPPDHLVIIATAENSYDLLPTIRSRSILLPMTRLSDEDMRAFAAVRRLPEAEARIAIAEGSPGLAASIDLEEFRERRDFLLCAFECGAGLSSWAAWVQRSEPFGSRKSEKLDLYLKLAYGVLEDILSAAHGCHALRNRDVQTRIEAIAQRVSFGWIEAATRAVDELVLMVRRNIQKSPALDAMIIILRNRFQYAST